MASNRQKFEGRLKELTSDINDLSERLQSKPQPSLQGSDRDDVSLGSKGNGAVNGSKEINDGGVGERHGRNGLNTEYAQGASGRVGKTRLFMGSSESLSTSGDGHVVETHRIIAERDALQSKCHKLERVITDLRHELSECEHTKMELSHLKRDHATLTNSLETSERIRQQQKAFISMLQSSSTNRDTHSLDKDGGDASISVTPSVVAENRVWLNSGLHTSKGTGSSSVVSGLSETDTDGESKGSRKGSKRSGRNASARTRSANNSSRNSGGVALSNARRGGGRDFLSSAAATGTRGPIIAGRASTRKPALPSGKPTKARSLSGSGSIDGNSNANNISTMPRTKSAPSVREQGTRPRKSSGSSAATTGEDSQLDSTQLHLSSGPSASSRQREYAKRLAYGGRSVSSGPGTPSRRNTVDTILTEAAVVMQVNKHSPTRYGSGNRVSTPLRGARSTARGATVSASPARRVPASPRCTFGSGHK